MSLGNKLSDIIEGVKYFWMCNKNDIMHYAGTGLIAGGAIWGCVQSTKLEIKVEKCQQRLTDAKEVSEAAETRLEKARPMAKAWLENAGTMVKLYGGPVLTFAVGTTLNETAHWEQKAQIGGLTAAVTAYEAITARYRKNIERVYGKDGLKALENGTVSGPVEKKVVDEKGKNKIKKATDDVVDAGDEDSADVQVSSEEYNRIFAPRNYCVKHGIEVSRSYGGEDDPEYLLSILKNTRDQLYNIMVSRCSTTFNTPGYLFVNEIYETLGFVPSQAGQFIGKIFTPGESKYHCKPEDIFDIVQYWDNDPEYGSVPIIKIVINTDGVIVNKVGLRQK